MAFSYDIFLAFKTQRKKVKAVARSNDNTQKKTIRLSIVRTFRQKGTSFQRSKREEKLQILQQVAVEHLDGLSDESQFEHAFREKSLIGVEELLPDVMTLQEMVLIALTQQHQHRHPTQPCKVGFLHANSF